MNKQEISESKEEMNLLCNKVRELIRMQEFQKCESLICSAMGEYPHAPEPHNLIGILLEKEGDHFTAMRHFRAAWALDPTYIPVQQNLDYYGTFFSHGKCAYDESDCPAEDKRVDYKIEYDEYGVGHVVRRT